MQIRTKAGLLMAMVTLAVTLICANSIINLNRLAGIDREVDIFNRINILMLESRRQEKNYQMRGMKTYGNDTLNSFEKWKKLVSEAVSLTDQPGSGLTPKFKETLSQIRNEIESYQAQFQEQVALVEKTGKAMDSVAEGSFVARARATQKLVKQIQEQAFACKRGIMTQSAWITYLLWGLVVVCLIIFGYVLIFHLVKPVTEVAGKLGEIAAREGNLTSRLQVLRQDEIGRLTSNFNKFVAAIQTIFKEIVSRFDILVEESGRLDDASSQLETHSEQTSNKATNMTSAGTQLSANMQAVSDASRDVADRIDIMAAATEELSTSIQNLAGNADQASGITGQAVERTRKATLQVKEMQKAAEQIGNVTQVITDISEKTDLLALNATIEAARAGEAGRGFAVVANEIKVLARQTSEATTDIQKSIQQVQQNTVTTTEEIQEILSIIHKIDSIVSDISAEVNEQRNAAGEVAENLHSTLHNVREVTTNMHEGADATADMSRDIVEVEEASRKIRDTASLVGDSAGKLTVLNQEIRDIMGRLQI